MITVSATIVPINPSQTRESVTVSAASYAEARDQLLTHIPEGHQTTQRGIETLGVIGDMVTVYAETEVATHDETEAVIAATGNTYSEVREKLLQSVPRGWRIAPGGIKTVKCDGDPAIGSHKQTYVVVARCGGD